MNFILYDKIGKTGQSLVEYLGVFALIAGFTVFASKFFTAVHTEGGTGSLDNHHRTATQQILANEIPPIYSYYGDGNNSPVGTYPPNYSNTSSETPP